MLLFLLALACGDKDVVGTDTGSSVDGGADTGVAGDGGGDGGSDDGGSDDGGGDDGGADPPLGEALYDVARGGLEAEEGHTVGSSVVLSDFDLDGTVDLYASAHVELGKIDAGGVLLSDLDGRFHPYDDPSLAHLLFDDAEQLGGSYSRNGQRLPDWDGDGYDELVLGNTSADYPSEYSTVDEGVIAVVSGPIVDGILTSDASLRVWGPRIEEFLGSIPPVADQDVDGDGVAELIVLDTGSSYSDYAWGYVGIFSSSDTGDVDADQGGILITGTKDVPVGSSAAAADLDGDGLPELVLGRSGVVAVFKGPVASADGSTASWTIRGDTDDSFGSQLEVADWDGDGLADFVVGLGSYGDDQGAVEIMTAAADSDLLLRLEGEPDTSLGSRGELEVGDLDEDGLPDLVVSSYDFDDHTGAAWIVAGTRMGTISTPDADLALIGGPHERMYAGYTMDLWTDSAGTAWLAVSQPNLSAGPSAAYVVAPGELLD